MRGRALIRTLRLFHRLHDGKGMTMHQIAAMSKCHLRTARRDLYALRAAGYHIVRTFEFGETPVWRMVK